MEKTVEHQLSFNAEKYIDLTARRRLHHLQCMLLRYSQFSDSY
jgi:hypothetical protein